jgi:iron complex outermembrane receptor protein
MFKHIKNFYREAKFCVLTVVLIFNLTLTAISAEIRGRVIDAVTNTPLANVNILVERTNQGAFSDAKGEFVIWEAPDNTFVISAGHIGYRVEKQLVKPKEVSHIEFSLTPVILQGEEVTVTSSRADIATAPVAFSNLSMENLREIYRTQEFPLLIEDTPGVFSYSDAGNPLGYSYLKIRGFDQKRVAVMINGIPLNDPEDHQVYWVDMPDLAANTNDIQIQRGLGYSQYGTSAFGGSVNILTISNEQSRKLESSLGYGSFNTRKFSTSFNSGIVDNTYQFYGRFSRIYSDGYREHSSFLGWSYYLSASRYGLNNTLTMNLYGGPEFLHASWDGTYQAILDTNRTYNPITYHNTVDNFHQPHYELHYTRELSPQTTLENTFYFIKGDGYWELYKDDEQLSLYGLTSNPALSSDLVLQQWVDKNQWGWIPRITYKADKYQVFAGGSFYDFYSHHFGKIIWVENPPVGSQADFEDHDYNGDIWEGSLFGSFSYQATPKLNLLFDAQFRHLATEFRQNPAGAFSGVELNRYEVTHNLLNPKCGASYKLNRAVRIYANAGFGQREPSQHEYWDAWQGAEDYGVDPLFKHSDTLRVGNTITGIEWSEPKVNPERLFDVECGARYQGEICQGSLNLFWMDLRNEIIYGGGMWEGYPVVGNAEKTLHRGVEAEGAIKIGTKSLLKGNFSFSRNTFESNDIMGLDPAYNPVPIKGKTVPLFPEIMSRWSFAYEIDRIPNVKFKPVFGLSYIGMQYLESTNMESAVIDPYLICNFRLLLETKIQGTDFRLQAVIDNLFDEKYETSGYYYEGNYYYPGAERNYYVEVTVGL